MAYRFGGSFLSEQGLLRLRRELPVLRQVGDDRRAEHRVPGAEINCKQSGVVAVALPAVHGFGDHLQGEAVRHSYALEDTVCNNAYTGISGIGSTLRAQGMGGQYMIAMSVEDIPTSIAEITFTVRAYVLDKDGVRTFESDTPNTIKITAPAN